MNENEKKAYLKSYEKQKKNGVPFFPDVLFKDIVVSFFILIALLGLVIFIGIPLEEQANPADTSYTPRPEWYFLFLFQLLKYFPGSLEVVGVVFLPTLLIVLLFILPFLDRSSKRHPYDRPVILGLVVFSVLGISFLTIQAVIESPPPVETPGGDTTATLYLQNCAGCHGTSIEVDPSTNLHETIAQGKHEGMPAWSGDLSTDEIDALVGFILSPGGSELFVDNCGQCHESPEQIIGEPIELKNVFDQGPDYSAHVGLEIPVWGEVLTNNEQNELLNFLVAPDGQRLYTVNCSSCHGSALAFTGDESQLLDIIRTGGQHLEMPPWQANIPPLDIDTLARYIVDPVQDSRGEELFDIYCSQCHGERIPRMDEFYSARDVIRSGGVHKTMPVWGDILTAEQLDALVEYSLSLSEGTSIEIGQELYISNCSDCHGDFGEGGPNPSRPDDIIAPISTAEYLSTRDDITLRAIIAQGQPNFGMSPFGSSYGGPLDDKQIDAIVSYIRSWQENPPVEFPPAVRVPTSKLIISGDELFTNLCAQCHGEDGSGGIGPSLIAPSFRENNTKEEIFDHINLGHEATAMIAWGEVLSSEQIDQLVEYILNLDEVQATEPVSPSGSPPSFVGYVLPIFESRCNMCHGELGGWDGSTYASVMSTGDHSPVVIPGDIDNSILAQKILGTQAFGTIMPPGGKLSTDEIQIILDWIEAGALE